jgi:hypothetical protein
MKQIILTLALLASSFEVTSQIGIVTLQKKSESVPAEMWYTIHEKGRENQMYYTTYDAESAGEVLRSVLDDMGIIMEDVIGLDELGDPYWGTYLGNGYYCTVYLHRDDEYQLYTVTILAEEE